MICNILYKKEREFSGSQTPEEDGNGSDGNNSLVYAFNFQELMYFVKKLGAMLESGVLTLLFLAAKGAAQ